METDNNYYFIMSRPKLGELLRAKTQVREYSEAVSIANRYGFEIVEVSRLMPNLKFTITFVKYKQLNQ